MSSFHYSTVFATTETAGSSDLLGSLGIDWKMLVLQSIAFLALLFLLSKFVYPVLLKNIEKREKLIEDSMNAAREAEKNAQETEDKVAKLMKQARTQADEVISGAKTEATALVEAAEQKSRERAERIVKDAHEQIAKDVVEAQKVLQRETLNLVVAATEKVVGKTVTGPVDKKVVDAALKEAA